MAAFLNAEYQLTVLLNSMIIDYGWLVGVVQFFAVVAIFLIVGFVALSLFINWPFFRISGKLLFLEALLSGAAAWLVNQFIGLLYWRKRPFAVFSDNIHSLVNKDVLAKSFPSDHAAVAMSLAIIIFLWSPRVGIWFIALAVLISVARIFAGVHYPSDVIVGLALGAIIGRTIHRFFV